ncbi:RNA 2',3'-cyclic phosphodiesterase [Frankia sp. Mgl5]|uniref:RNA 2',3'-cyclic phosphodiesterase n=1 Tax=Frankia sp. Mgl5 TaxID=2933793 RepID=UPI00200CF96D|nr:RNA 2',3'-cyclic phosphodiesterase [Frankia sp. Mgl5]MCK9929105.1 RNA 2',3'-cyclic phosphodiesterase [Frankia sp. Mgl5]
MTGPVPGRERLFVALLPPAELVRDLTTAVSEVTAAAAGAGVPRLRWTDPSRWHVTLAFLGPVELGTRPALAERLGRVAHRHGPVELRLDGAGRFGHRVLWVRVAGDLGPLAAGVRRAAVRAGADGGDDRPLRAHLTLARVPEGTAADLRPLVRALGEIMKPSAWTARTLTLMSSVGGPSPVYSVEGEWDLSGS